MSVDRSRLSACVLMTPGWSLAECIEGWQRAGLAGIGVNLAVIKAAGGQAAIRMLKGSGLRVHYLQNLDPFDPVDPARFTERIDTTRRRLDLAAELGVDCCYAMCGPRGDLGWDEAQKRLVDQIHLLLPHLHERGVRVALEPVQPIRQDLSFVNLAADTLDILDQVLDPAIGYAFDFWHLWWQRGIEDLARTSAGRVLSCQPSDHKAVTMRTLDRAIPGKGIAPVDRLVRALEAGGYGGMYDLEVLSPDNEERGYDATLAQSVAGFAEICGGLSG